MFPMQSIRPHYAHSCILEYCSRLLFLTSCDLVALCRRYVCVMCINDICFM